MSGPAVASSRAAQSRTERVRTCWATSPFKGSPPSGPSGGGGAPPPRRAGGGGPAAGAAGGALRVPGVAGRPQEDGLGGGDKAELRRVRLPDDDQSGPLVAGNQRPGVARGV